MLGDAGEKRKENKGDKKGNGNANFSYLKEKRVYIS